LFITGHALGTDNEQKRPTMATKEDFSEEAWAKISTLPTQVMIAAAISQVDDSADSRKELAVGMAELAQAGKEYFGNELMQWVLDDLNVQETEGKIDHVVTMSPEEAAAFVQQTLDDCAAAVEAIKEKAGEQEAAEFAGWILDIAEKTAQAAASGGFLGIGADEISKSEHEFLFELGSRLDPVMY
jgi:hypothetical protein